MGLIREVSLINRALDENKRLLTTKEQKKLENDKLINDIKNECKAIIFDLIESDKESDVIAFIDENVGKVSDFIINKKEVKQVDYVENDRWKTKKELVNSYYIDDIYQLELIIQDIYIKEYKNIIKLKKMNLDSKKEQLQEQLLEKLRNILKLDENVGGIFEQLERDEIKRDLINEITDDRDEKTFFNKIYYKTLNELKRGYKYELQQYKEIKKLQQRKIKKNDFGGFILLGICHLLKIGNKKH